MQSIHDLNQMVYSEPTNKKLRPYLVEYVKYYSNQAQLLSEHELLHGQGGDYAANICGAIAWQGAVSVPNDSWITNWIDRSSIKKREPLATSDSWITKEDEPILWNILEIASLLDVDSSNIDQWHKLFDLVEAL